MRAENKNCQNKEQDDIKSNAGQCDVGSTGDGISESPLPKMFTPKRRSPRKSMKYFQVSKESPKSQTSPLLKMEWMAQEKIGFQKNNSPNQKGSSEESPIILSDSDEGSPVLAKRRCVTSSIKSGKKIANEASPEVVYSDSDDTSPPKATSLAEDDSELDMQSNVGKIKRQLSFDNSDDDLPSLSSPSETVCENSSEPFCEYYDEDPLLPIFNSLQEGIKTSEAVKILLEGVEEKLLAKSIPHQINRNAIFIYNSEAIGGNWKNSLCDGMGVWKQTGRDAKYADADEDENGLAIKYIEKDKISDSSMKVLRYKYVNQSISVLHRVAIIIVDPASDLPLMENFIVQYYFTESNTGQYILPHGNSKDSSKPFIKTSETIKAKIRKMREEKNKPKEIFHTILEEEGGIEKIKGGAFLPRNRKQIYNVKESFNRDPVVECSDMAKLKDHTSEKFIRDVRSAPEFTLFLSNNRQLQELEKFCTSNKYFSVLGVDTTFNIGSYYVTIFTYRNLMLLNNKGVEPVMIGPTLVHQKKSFDSYFKLPSTLLQECKGMKHLKVFGTDGDVCLSTAMEATFPESKHLLCDIHMQDNIERKLREFNITGVNAKGIVRDVFGCQDGELKVPGLVDSTSAEEFNVKLINVENKWSNIPNGQKFLEYFMEHKAELIRNCMSADLRSMCGLGFPPKPYTQNANECINSVLKSSLQSGQERKKPLDPFEFAQKLERIVKQQEEEVKLSLIGRGQYKVKDEYRHLCVAEVEYWRKRKPQRDAVYTRMLNEPLKPPVEEDENDRDQPSVLSVSASESNITSIPYRTLNEIFNEANEIASEKSSIVQKPGSDLGSSYLVKDKNRLSDPRHVKCTLTTNNLACDAKCARWNSFKLCSHTVAVGEHLGFLRKYLEIYKRKKIPVNITRMANTNMLNTRGKKPSKSTERRKGASNKGESIITGFVKDASEIQREKDSHHSEKQPFHLTFLAGLIKVCYGCGQQFAIKQRTPPHDMILKRYDHRLYKSPRSKEMKRTTNLQNTYYHLNTDCARKKCPEFEIQSDIIIHHEIKLQLKDSHRRLLQEMGVPIDFKN